MLEFSFFISIRYVICFRVKYKSYCYTQLCNYKEEFVFEPINNELNIPAGCILFFTKSLNASYLKMDGKSSVN